MNSAQNTHFLCPFRVEELYGCEKMGDKEVW